MRIIQRGYRTYEVAKIAGLHPNTVRLYEKLGLISVTSRQENGYRVFLELHISQLKLARVAFQIEVMQNGLRKKAVDIIKTTARCDFQHALLLTQEYLVAIQNEVKYANDAVDSVRELICCGYTEKSCQLKRNDVSQLLGISMDAIRNWEMNGLLKVKRKENGYRFYSEEEIKKLKIIRTLRCANYSLSAILRMMNALDEESSTDIKEVLNRPNPEDEIISVCDRLLISLDKAKINALLMEQLLNKMKVEFSNPPL